MQNNCEKNEVKNDLFIRVKASKSPKSKLPTEQIEKVSMIAVEVSEAQTDTAEVLDLNIHIQSRAGSKLTKADAGKA